MERKEQARRPAGPVREVKADFVRTVLRPRKIDGHKGDFGKLLIVAGAVGYTGAPYLAAASAVRSGCGLVYLGVPEGIWQVEASKCVCAMPFPLSSARGGGIGLQALPSILERLEGCGALAIGPGMGREEETAQTIREILSRTEKAVVLDADGINALEGHIDVLDRRRGRTTILTPHEGEFARIGASCGGGRAAACVFARDHGCVLVLKGHRTVIAAPEGETLVNTTGDTGLAKGGSGDVLTGLIASLLVQGASPVQAAAGGVYLHGRAGEIASERKTPWCVAMEDVLDAFPDAFREIVEG